MNPILFEKKKILPIFSNCDERKIIILNPKKKKSIKSVQNIQFKNNVLLALIAAILILQIV